MRGFLGANLFLLGLVLLGAALSAIGAALVDAKPLALVWIAAGVGATVATGYVGAAAHRWIARRLAR
jgi:hypothetical protein